MVSQHILGNVMQNIINGAQCRAARALIGWSQEELRVKAQVSRKTLADFEKGVRTPYDRTIRDIQKALEDAGLEFIPATGGGVGLRLKG